jgi:hypothetical protein
MSNELSVNIKIRLKQQYILYHKFGRHKNYLIPSHRYIIFYHTADVAVDIIMIVTKVETFDNVPLTTCRPLFTHM